MKFYRIFGGSKTQRRSDCDDSVIHNVNSGISRMRSLSSLVILVSLLAIGIVNPVFAKFPKGLYYGVVDIPPNTPLVPFIASLYPDGQAQIAYISAADAFQTQRNSEEHVACTDLGSNNFSCIARQWICLQPNQSMADKTYGPSGNCNLRIIPLTYHCNDASCDTLVGQTCITSTYIDADTLLPAPVENVCTPNLPVTMIRATY